MNNSTYARIVDSHTGGEPTRIIVEGGPDLGAGTMVERLERFRTHFDAWRRALVTEPRGSDVLVGGVLCPPLDPANTCGVIFFNNVGYLGMCGHGTIGLMATLAYLGRLGAGPQRIETPVGTVSATQHEDGTVTVANVLSYRLSKAVVLEVPSYGKIVGDIAWGGNWFFLCENHGLTLDTKNIPALTSLCHAIRCALVDQGLTGAGGVEIDHVELLGPALDRSHHGRSFVMCPGGAYDRSPCGTGTSAKLACLAAGGMHLAGQPWHQESIVNSVFTGHFEWPGGGAEGVLPFIRGQAHVNLDARVVFDPRDAFGWGLS